jgi:hypothetical protein
MTIYYICRADDLADLNLSQSDDEQLACEITIAADMYDDINTDLLAVEADSKNGTYAYIKGAALYSLDLTSSNIQIWKAEGEKIYEYLLGPEYSKSRFWGAYGALAAEIGCYEAICEKSIRFNSLSKGFSYAVTSTVEEHIREQQIAFVAILEELYEISEIKAVTS